MMANNPLFNILGGSGMPNNFLTQFMQFKQNFKGNPQQQIQQMLNSGRISQQQYNNAVQMANQFKQFIK